MAIPFSDVSPNVRASNIFIELAGVKTSLASLFIKPLGGLIGMYDPLKTSIVDYEPVKVLNSDDVGNRCGFGSHIHRQALKLPSAVYLQGNGVYMFPVPEEAAGTASTEDITITGAATSAGTLYFGIGGVLVQVSVASGDALGDIATAIEDAITALRDIAVTGAATLGVCSVTAKFKGLAGDEILIKQNPGGEVQENQAPAGVTVALSEVDGYLAGGASDPSVEDVFFDSGGNDKLGNRWYTIFTMPFTDAINIGFHVASAELRADPATSRMFGSHGSYIKETLAQAQAIPATINNEYIGTIWENRNESPTFELAAELVGHILDSQNQAPNQPYKTLALDGPADDTVANRTYSENDALFRAGMSYCDIDESGILRLGDVALTRRLNDVGGDTEEWFDAVTLYARQAKAYSLEQLFLTEKYQRAVVVDNSAVTKVTYAIAPKDVISDLTKLITDLWGPYGWSKNIDEIIAGITAEINDLNQGRIDAELVDDEARALRIIAMRYAYKF